MLYRLHTAIVAHAVAAQEALKIMQLGVNELVAQALFRRDVRELRQNDVIRLVKRADTHELPPVFPSAAHAEVRIDQQKRLDGQIFKFQIPCGMVRRNVRDGLQIALGKPLPCVVIMQIRDARGIRTAAGKFADVV